MSDKPQVQEAFDKAQSQGHPVPSGETVFVTARDGYQILANVRGNSDGQPIIVLHGGPGAGPSEAAEKLFDYSKYRVISITQRECIQYRGLCDSYRDPALENLPDDEKLVALTRKLDAIRNITFDDLITDIEDVRRHVLGENQKVSVMGSSWGGPLAAFYAGYYPDKVKQVVVRGTSLVELCGRMNPADVEKTTEQYEKNPFFTRFVDRLRSDDFFGENFDQSEIMHRLYHVMFDEDGHGQTKAWTPEQKKEAAMLWRSWNVSLQYSYGTDEAEIQKTVDKFVTDDWGHSFNYAGMFAWTLEKQYPLWAPEQGEKSMFHAMNIIRNNNIPFVAVHGIGDDICPFDNAVRLVQQVDQTAIEEDFMIRNEAGDVADVRGLQFGQGLLTILPVLAGHAMHGNMMPKAMKAVLEHFSGDSLPLQTLYPDLNLPQNPNQQAAVVVVTQGTQVHIHP